MYIFHDQLQQHPGMVFSLPEFSTREIENW